MIKTINLKNYDMKVSTKKTRKPIEILEVADYQNLVNSKMFSIIICLDILSKMLTFKIIFKT
jgi:hypothetical protein